MAMPMPLALLVLPTLFLTGCAQSHLRGPDEVCDGPRPAIDACASGALWAECGGTAVDPVFACRRADGRCYWFDGGCVATDFVASPCPADGVCCVGTVNPYPFDESWQTFDTAAVNVYETLYGWGTAPWDRARERNLDVVVTPLAPTEASVACTGGDALTPPCNDTGANLRVTRALHGALTLTVDTTRPSLGGWSLSVEVIPDADATLHARVCRVRFTDSISPSCRVPGAACATSGAVELDAFPADELAAASTRAHVTATFSDGSTLDARL